jgi:Protein of unknown function (DUF1501)
VNPYFERFIRQNPHPHRPFWERPTLSRRKFFRILGTGVSGYALFQAARPLRLLGALPVTPMNTAKNCIYILLAGAPAHTDTFDLKEGPWTPSSFNPTSYGDIRFPQGLLPNIAAHLNDIAIVRSARAWALVHSLAQTWTQIGRSPASALGSISPNIGSVVALEKFSERSPQDILPGFLSFNAGGTQVGAGYFPSAYAPFLVRPQAGGLANTTHPDGKDRWNSRMQFLHLVDDPLRQNSPLGHLVEDMDAYYSSAGQLMYNDLVQSAFSFSSEERTPYGDTTFGDACLLATKVLQAQLGTRFIQITLGGWDNHANIYTSLPPLATTLDRGYGGLLDGLRQKGLLDQTLVVVAGEFGRTVGPLNNQQGRDHFLQQSILFAGGGVKGGRTIGSTDATGAITAVPGWSRNRDVRPEDVEASVYSALGINWTTILNDDPLGRGFEYVPFANYDIYGPINELWG